MNESMKEALLGVVCVVAIGLLALWLGEIGKKGDLKIEAVERGYAQYTDGKWGWLNE